MNLTSNSGKNSSPSKKDEWVQNSLGFTPESDDHREARPYDVPPRQSCTAMVPIKCMTHSCTDGSHHAHCRYNPRHNLLVP